MDVTDIILQLPEESTVGIVGVDLSIAEIRYEYSIFERIAEAAGWGFCNSPWSIERT